ncbi:MAG: glycosyltransferase family 39 protein [Dehalococcoidia bacterium]
MAAAAPHRGLLPQFRPAPELRWLVALFLLAFALRAAWVVSVNPDPLPRYPYDPAFYYNAALGLADGEGYRDVDDQQTNLLPPGYPLVLAGSYLLFGDDLLVGKLMNAFFGAATVVLVYALATRVADRRVGLVAAGIMALFPGQIFFTTVLMTETFFVALTVLFLLLVLISTVERQPANWELLALGELVGFMALVRAEAMLLVLALAVLWMVLTASWRDLGRYMAVFLIGVLPLLLVWSVRNYTELGDVEVRSGGGTALAMGLSPNFDEQLAGTFVGGTAPPLSDTFRHYGTHPQDIALVPLQKLSYLFGGENDVFTWIQWHVPRPLSPGAAARWSDLVNGYYYAVGVLAALGIAAWLAAPNRARMTVLWLLAAWSGFYLIFVPQERYHFPVIPLLSVAAAFALVHGLRFVRDGGARRTLATLRTGGFAAAFAPEALNPSGRGTARRSRDEAGPAKAPVLSRRSLVLLFGFTVLVLAMTAVVLQGFVDSAAAYRDFRRQVDLQTLGKTIDNYHTLYGGLPSTGGIDQSEPFCVSEGNKACEFRALWPGPDFPVDPSGEQNGYWYGSDGQSAVVYALRETDTWSGPLCEWAPPQLAGRGDLQCLRLPLPAAGENE